jgi:TPP-dependent pyruvate/acetoin dehydrogenase alpha subunit
MKAQTSAPSPAKSPPRSALNIELYRSLYLIRSAETGIRKYYHEDDMKTPMHMSMGEEAIVAGVCRALGQDSQVYGSYRSHALYLAKTHDTDGFFAEMYGKATGPARGKAGSMHMSSPENGLMCCAAVVASTIPLAVGTAYANKVRNTGRLTAAFFGDGAMDAGVFWESLNSACVMRLPLAFVCEDNGLAVHTERRQRQGFASATQVASQFDCAVFESDTTDVEEVHRIAGQAAAEMLRTGRPAFLRFRWYRYLEHVGVNEDFDVGYRSKQDYLKWLKVDPIALQRAKLVAEGWLAEHEMQDLEQGIDRQVERSIQAAKAAPLSGEDELFNGLFA